SIERRVEDFSIEDIIVKWDKFIKSVNEKANLRNITKRSWERCKEFGMTQETINYRFLTENELKQKREEYYEIIEIVKPYMEQLSLSMLNIPHLIALSDKDGWIIEIEGDIENFGGKDFGIYRGASWAEKDKGNNGIGTALLLKKNVFVYGIEHYCSAYKNLACFGAPIRNEYGEVIAALDISVLSNYADPKRISLALACVNSIELTISRNNNLINNKKRDDDIKELLATIVHDLKNPLTVITAISQLGEKSSNDKKEQMFFKKIRKQVVSLTNIVDNLLAIHKTNIEKELLYPSEIINEVLKEISPLCHKNNIDVKFDVFEESKILLDSKLFKRVIYNLIMNSIKVMETGGFVHIEIENDLDGVLISIEDNGPGIEEEFKASIFEPFVSKRPSGTGIGLYMVHKTITEIHNGDIWCDSEVGVGTTFFIKLPLSIN
ncbi:MAG: ATP-binding protein, partial [Bacillota bacterium]